LASLGTIFLHMNHVEESKDVGNGHLPFMYLEHTVSINVSQPYSCSTLYKFCSM
jgi:hypothetical protein